MDLYRESPVFHEFVFDTPIGEQAAGAMGVDRVRLYYD